MITMTIKIREIALNGGTSCQVEITKKGCGTPVEKAITMVCVTSTREGLSELMKEGGVDTISEEVMPAI